MLEKTGENSAHSPDDTQISHLPVKTKRQESSSEYENVILAPLNLKGSTLRSFGEKKKRMKKSRINSIGIGEYELTDAEIRRLEDYEELQEEAKLKEEVVESNPIEDITDLNVLKTDAQRRFDDETERIAAAKITKIAQQTHRQLIEAFNTKLQNEPDHFDLPKVGPG
ncbi:putative protein FAM32A [Blattamonas nauphoetae]|uniref:Uncharacterized protein n=1 Tax=Blattamonas nauphoetae TaxID=2049346 RepID=A0ABQ9XBI4_9EUKA|nr:putative protein FAM32A [Blattamonas nauphoetae]